MKAINKAVWLVSFLVIGNLSTAYGEMLQGKVTAVNQQQNSITIQGKDETGKMQEKSVEFNVDQKSRFNGYSGLSDVAVGDHIKIDTEKNWFGNVKAKSVSKVMGSQQIRTQANVKANAKANLSAAEKANAKAQEKLIDAQTKAKADMQKTRDDARQREKEAYKRENEMRVRTAENRAKTESDAKANTDVHVVAVKTNIDSDASVRTRTGLSPSGASNTKGQKETHTSANVKTSGGLTI